MSWILTEKEMAAVMAMDGPKRYEYFIKKAVDQQVIWSLWQDDGWAVLADDAGRQFVPVWPHEKYAEAYAVGGWNGYAPKAIELGSGWKRGFLGWRETDVV